MKIRYEFADGTVPEAEVEEAIGAVIVEDNLFRKERYHCYSLDVAQSGGAKYASEETPETQMEQELDAERIIHTTEEEPGQSHNCCSPFLAKLKYGDYRAVMEALADCSAIDAELEAFSSEIEVTTGLIQKLVDENAIRKLYKPKILVYNSY